jgi:DnaJ-domain-containing proteins 1
MKILHPDKHTLQSIEKQQEVADLSSKVIRGYEILKDDYQRALHLLELHGEALELEGTTASMQILQENDDGDEKKNAVDTDVLFQVMEIREQIDAVDLKGGDDADGKKRRELNRLLQENQGRIEETVEFLKEAFGRNDWVHAKRLVATLQYWNRIKETILEKL